MRLTFVVGTGRCGSTMLSAILREHPDVLSLSEFFGTLRAAAHAVRSPRSGQANGRVGGQLSGSPPGGGQAGGPFPGAELDGRELWELLTRPFPMLDEMISSGLRIAEPGYPFGHGRFTLAAGIPLICHYVLPMLTADPDALYDRLAGQVPAWPRRPAAAQCEAFMAYLAGQLGRPVVVERSAASLNMVAALRKQFPAARFVHLYRDGPDCALSMSRHPVFRREILALAAAHAAGQAVGRDGPVPLEPGMVLPERFAGLVFPPYDAEKLMSYPIAVEVFARYQWTPQICAGVEALGQLPPGHCLSLRYADLVRDPAATLSAFCAFIEVDAPPAWLASARAMIDPARTGAAAHLAPPILAALRTACEPGTRALTASPLAGHPVPNRPAL